MIETLTSKWPAVGPKTALSTTGRRSRTAATIAFFAPWMMDYRSEDGDKVAIVIQSFALAVSIAVFVLKMQGKRARAPSGLLVTCTIFGVFTLDSTLTGLYRGQHLTALAALDVPLVLFVLSALLTYRMFVEVEDPSNLVRSITMVLIGGTIAKSVLMFVVFGAEIDTIRYQVLSSGVITASALTVVGLFSLFSAYTFLLSVINIAAISVSVTRTQVAVLIGMMGSIIVLSPCLLLRYSVLKRLGIVLCIAIGTGTYGLATKNVVVERWIGRLSHADEIGFDITAATRRAEVEYQLEQLSASVPGLVFGFGLGAENHLIGINADLIREVPGIQTQADLVDVGYGHNIYTGLLYTGGAVFGGAMVVALIYMFLFALRLINQLAGRMKADPFAFVGVWGALAVVGISVYGLLGGTLGDRGHGLWFGMSVGMMFAAKYRAQRVH